MRNFPIHKIGAFNDTYKKKTKTHTHTMRQHKINIPIKIQFIMLVIHIKTLNFSTIFGTGKCAR